uniref:Uncharacterized protein n=1 Tax=Periophthalmus magnuspinnatus TaxID=409849 RepID=A0A3B4BDY6_9GOBI
MQVGRKPCWRQLQASFFRLLCLIPTGFPVRSVDMQRTTDNITIRQGDTAIIRSVTLLLLLLLLFQLSSCLVSLGMHSCRIHSPAPELESARCTSRD